MCLEVCLKVFRFMRKNQIYYTIPIMDTIPNNKLPEYIQIIFSGFFGFTISTNPPLHYIGILNLYKIMMVDVSLSSIRFLDSIVYYHYFRFKSKDI